METANLGELITNNKEVFFNELNDVINPTFKGLINPMGYDNMLDLLIAKINRPLFPRQSRLVAAAMEHLASTKSLLVSSEMGTGKCLHPQSRVVFTHDVMAIGNAFVLYANTDSEVLAEDGRGSWFSLNKELVVPSLDEESGKMVLKPVNRFFRQQVKESLRKIKIAGKSEIIVTKAHKFLTPMGWTNQIKVGDYVAVPKTEPVANQSSNIVDSELLAWIIGEGHCAFGFTRKDKSKSSPYVRITQKDKKATAHIKELSEKFGFSTTLRKDRNELSVVSIYRMQHLVANGVAWSVSKDKEIPAFMMQESLANIVRFLAAYIDAEGSVHPDKSSIEISTASETIAYQLVSLMRKVGVVSTVGSMYKAATNGLNIKRKYFRISISGDAVRELSAKCIGFIQIDGKREKMSKILELAHSNNNLETIYVFDVVSELFKLSGISRAKSNNLFANVYVNGGQKTMNKHSVEKLIVLIEAIKSKTIDSRPIDNFILDEMKEKLESRMVSDVYFVKVKKVEEVEYDGYVYDLEVEETHNFIAENMMVHNTAMALGIALDNKYHVNFIMCPPHLVSKWADEIRTMYRDVEYRIVIVTRWSDLTPYTKRKLKKEGVKYFFIVSRETSKLSYPKQEAYAKRFKFIEKEVTLDGVPMYVKVKVAIACCPRCGTELSEGKDETSSLSVPYKCTKVFLDKEEKEIGKCDEVLRQVDKTASPNLQTRLSVAEYIKRQWPKGSIDLLIADEIHEYKGGATGQGNAFAQISSVSKKIVGLTGTLLNGYASSLFYILWRLNPSLMKNQLNLDYNQVKQFVQIYGAHEETVEVLESSVEGIVTKMGKVIAVKEKPKISPYLLSLLLDFTIFLRLDEIKMENLALPDYDETIELVDVDEEWNKRYMSYIAEIAGRIRKDKRFLGNLANDALCVPDMPYSFHTAQNEIVYSPRVVRSSSEIPALIENIKKASHVSVYESDIKVLPRTGKELRLIELVKEELSQGRNCLVYVHFSNKGVGDSIATMLSEALSGFKINQLKANVDAKKRQAWIKANPCDVLVCNPELVKTGLDLLEFPTIIFYETSYNVFTLKQASRRSWRIGQTEAVKVMFMAYRDSPQHKALELIGAKVAAANSLEGRLSGDDDLSSMGEDDDNIQLALAKAILNGESTAKEIKMNSIKRFGDREWDAFEEYYRDRLNAFKHSEKITPAVKSILEKKEDLLKEDPFDLFDEPIATPVPASQPISMSLFGFDDDGEISNDKIVIYKRIKKGGKTVEQRIEVTRAEIDEMVGATESAPMQLSLF